MDQDEAQRQLRRILIGVILCFTLSGVTGLVYEVLWVRMLGLVFGHTVFAITTVLAAFMAGLGLGSFLLGRSIDRQTRPLRIYGMLEIGIGLSCLAVPFVMPFVSALYLALHRALSLSFFAFSLAQFALIFLLLLVPTTLMGATLPVLSRFFAHEGTAVGRGVGFLYALNTFGAVLGTAFAGYFLLPSFGMRGTVYLAATLNIGLGVLAMIYDLHVQSLGLAAPAPGQAARGDAPDDARGFSRVLAALTVVGLGLSGAASMIYEIAWTRALSLILGSSTYAFTSMLLAFLVGIALGSALFSRWWGHRPVDPLAFGFIQLGIGLSAVLILPAFGRLPDVLLRILAISLAPTFVIVVQVAVSIVAMIVPTLLIGASFPCAINVAARGFRHVGQDVGRIYAVNTLGAILGTVAGGFVLIPVMGVANTVKVGVMLNVLVGVILAIVSMPIASRRRLTAAAALTVLTLAALVSVPAWNRAVMASGVSVYAKTYASLGTGVTLSDALVEDNLLLYEDGISATVTIHQRGGNIYLKVNGKTDASTGADMHTQLMSGHLPILAHPDPKFVLVVGLGSGVTVGAVAAHPVERIDVVEIEPAVVRGSRFFAGANRNALEDPRVHLTIADARNFLLSTTRKYDIIISEPSNPWIGGIAALFSEEFYEIARSRLRPGGVMLQWIQGYRIVPADLQMVVATFQRAFPATSIWHGHGIGDNLLLGRQQIRPLDLERVRAVYRTNTAFRQDLTMLGLHSPEAILADFILNEVDAGRYAQNADLNTDDLLPLEFSAPRSLHLDTARLNFQVMLGFRTSEFPVFTPGSGSLDSARIRYDLGVAYVKQQMAEPAAIQFQRAVTLDPGHLPAWLELARLQRVLNRPLQSHASIDAVLRRDPNNAEAYFELGQLYGLQQLPDRALELVGKAVALAPKEAKYHLYYASLLESHGRDAEALSHYLTARRDRPREVAVLDGLGQLYLKQGRPGEAVAVLQEAAGYHPENPALQDRLGTAYLAANRGPEAVAALKRAVKQRPMFAPSHVNLGYAHAANGDSQAAIEALERGLALDPALTGASQKLSGLYVKVYGSRSIGK